MRKFRKLFSLETNKNNQAREIPSLHAAAFSMKTLHKIRSYDTYQHEFQKRFHNNLCLPAQNQFPG